MRSILLLACILARVQAQTASDPDVDKHPECVAWAAAGECFANQEYMLSMCQSACMAQFKAESDESGVMERSGKGDL